MKPWLRVAGAVAGIAATAASAYFIAASWRGQDIGAYASARGLAGIGIATACYIAGVMLSALAWRALLRSVDLDNRWLELSGIVAATQIGKYLPGNIAQHAGRAALSLGRGIGPVPLVVTGILEVALLAIASVGIGGLALLLSGRFGALLDVGDGGMVAGIALLAMALVLAVPLLRRYGPALVARFAPARAQALAQAAFPPPAAIGRAFVLYAMVYVAFGAGIILMSHLLLGGGQDAWLLLASFCLAWIVGFATPGAPAGIGVREAVMLALLAGPYSPPDASAIVLALRLATTAGDVLLLPIGWLQLRMTGRRPE